MSWRPEGWPKCPCDECEKKEEDEYGLLCNLACGKYTAWLNREAGADALLEMLREQGMEVGKGCISCVFALPPPARFNNGYVVFIPENQP